MTPADRPGFAAKADLNAFGPPQDVSIGRRPVRAPLIQCDLVPADSAIVPIGFGLLYRHRDLDRTVWIPETSAIKPVSWVSPASVAGIEGAAADFVRGTDRYGVTPFSVVRPH